MLRPLLTVVGIDIWEPALALARANVAESPNAARIEVPHDFIHQLNEPDTRAKLDREFRELGFESVTVDPKGFRSGSLNEGLAVHQIQSFADKR